MPPGRRANGGVTTELYLGETVTPRDTAERFSSPIALEGQVGEAFPVRFRDLHGEQGHPIRATVTEMGPLLLPRMLGLNDARGGR